MDDSGKSREDLIAELQSLRKENKALNKSISEKSGGMIIEADVYGNVLQAIQIPLFVINKNHEVIFWNQALEKMSGISAEEVLSTKDHWRAFYPENRYCMADYVVDEYYSAIESKYAGKYIQSNYLANAYEAVDFLDHLGENGRWLRITVGQLRDENDLIIGAVETLEDVSDRVLAEKGLKQERDYLNNILNNSADAIGIVDSKGKFVRINRRTEEMFGYNFEEISKIHSMDLYAYAQEKEDLLLKLRRDGYVSNFEVHIKRGDNRIIPFGMSISLLKDENGEIQGSVAVGRDLTDIKKTQAELKKSRDYLHNILYNSADGIGIVDATGRFSLFNKRAEEQFGYTFEELKDKPVTELYADPEQRNRMFKELKRRGYVRDYEVNLKTKDGKVKPFGLSISQIRDEKGNNMGSVTVARDLTETKRIQAELKRRKEEAEAASKAKGEFLANMSHEIRTPMNAIIGMSTLALNLPQEPKTYEYLNIIHSSAKNLLGIINDVLDFSKIEAGKMDLETRKFQLLDVLENIFDLFREKVSEKDIEMNLSLAEDVPNSLYGDSLRLSQVLTNLTTNAVKFTEKGEILIEVFCRKNFASKVLVQFSVKDTGTGIPPEKIEHLFDPFTQADGSSTRKYGGTGLGLTISKRLVEMMGGEIWATSELGKGSSFNFTAMFEKMEEEQEGLPVLPTEIKNIRCLVVDDNKMTRITMVKMLNTLTVEAEDVSSGKEAIERLKEENDKGTPFSLLLMDWLMPEMDGITTAERIKSTSGISDIPIIIMTAFGREEEIKKAKVVGVEAFLSKPIKISLLCDTISDIFGKSQTIKEPDQEKLITNDSIILERIKGSELLLVEDNLINQQVAVDILSSADVEVNCVDNGKQAVDALFAESGAKYQAVLMDVQMPVMNGFEATHKIRQDERFSELPIIAMTAHAMKGDKEQCLEAGMDDYVSKPIDPEELFNVLGKWIQPRLDKSDNLKKKKETPEAKKEEKKKSEVLPDSLPGLDIKQALQRLRGNQKLYLKIINDFKRDYAHIAQEIEKQLRNGEISKVAETAHTLKGLGGNIGALRFAEASKDIENAMKQGSAEDIQDLMLELEQSLEELTQSIDSLLQQNGQDKTDLENKGSTTGVKANIEEIEPVLQNMSEFLKKRDPVHTEECLFFIKDMLSGYEQENMLKTLDKQVNNLDFAKALTTVDEIRKQLGL